MQTIIKEISSHTNHTFIFCIWGHKKKARLPGQKISQVGRVCLQQNVNKFEDLAKVREKIPFRLTFLQHLLFPHFCETLSWPESLFLPHLHNQRKQEYGRSLSQKDAEFKEVAILQKTKKQQQKYDLFGFLVYFINQINK